jgi:hypothetical protein
MPSEATAIQYTQITLGPTAPRPSILARGDRRHTAPQSFVHIRRHVGSLAAAHAFTIFCIEHLDVLEGPVLRREGCMRNAPQLIQRNHHTQVLEAPYGARNILARTIPMLVGGPYLDFCSPFGRRAP